MAPRVLSVVKWKAVCNVMTITMSCHAMSTVYHVSPVLPHPPRQTLLVAQVSPAALCLLGPPSWLPAGPPASPGWQLGSHQHPGCRNSRSNSNTECKTGEDGLEPLKEMALQHNQCQQPAGRTSWHLVKHSLTARCAGIAYVQVWSQVAYICQQDSTPCVQV